MPSMFDGIDVLVDQWLAQSGLDIDNIGQAPHYVHQTTLLRLGPLNVQQLDAVMLVQHMLDTIVGNWTQHKPKTPRPSDENWEFRRNDYIAAQNRSPEVTLERTIARVAPPRTWYNQIPTCASLLYSNSDSHCNIDLAYAEAGAAISCIELKVDSNTPLSAAVQIVGYGLMYAFSRLHATEIGYTANKMLLMRAKKVHLRVLAPLNYYEPYSLAVLKEIENRLNQGVATLSSNYQLPPFDFQFWSFPPEFHWPRYEYTDNYVCNALEAIGPLEVLACIKNVSQHSHGGREALEALDELKRRLSACATNPRPSIVRLRDLLGAMKLSTCCEPTEGRCNAARRFLALIRPTLDGAITEMGDVERFIKLCRGEAEARATIGRIENDLFQKFIQRQWDADDDGNVSSQFVCGLFCFGCAPKSPIASQVRDWFDDQLGSETYDLSFANCNATVGEARAKELRSAAGHIEGTLKQLLPKKQLAT